MPGPSHMSRIVSHTWAMPVLLGVLSLVGLLTALFSDSWGDWLSWVALGVPAIICLWPFIRGIKARDMQEINL